MLVSKPFVTTNFLAKLVKSACKTQSAQYYNRAKIGNRDWVCFGKSGSACYNDSVDYPFPSVRFKENTNELLALREKEKGDWRKLSIDEKKILYRASFRQTLSEVQAPTGKWKSILGWTLFFTSLGIWAFVGEKLFIYDPLPKTMEEEWRRASLRKMIDLKMGHLTGVSSRWDYEKDNWKK